LDITGASKKLPLSTILYGWNIKLDNSIHSLDTGRKFEFNALTVPRLKRETGENPVRTRRCNPALKKDLTVSPWTGSKWIKSFSNRPNGLSGKPAKPI
jgi:cAMP phosphodiesterase